MRERTYMNEHEGFAIDLTLKSVHFVNEPKLTRLSSFSPYTRAVAVVCVAAK